MLLSVRGFVNKTAAIALSLIEVNGKALVAILYLRLILEAVRRSYNATPL